MRCRWAVCACVLAAAGLSVLASAGVSEALPAFFECAKLKGAALEKGCVREGGKGGFELREGVGKGKPFKGKGAMVELRMPALEREVTCTSSKLSGALSSASSVSDVVIELSGCATGAVKCQSPMLKRGKIETAKLAGVIGLLPGGRGGLDLKAESGSVLASFACEGHDVTVEGSVVGELTPIDTLTKTMTMTFAVNGEGFQDYKSLEGQPEDVLLTTLAGLGTFESGLESVSVNKGEDLLLSPHEPCVEGTMSNPSWWPTQPDCESGEEQTGGLWHPI